MNCTDRPRPFSKIGIPVFAPPKLALRLDPVETCMNQINRGIPPPQGRAATQNFRRPHPFERSAAFLRLDSTLPVRSGPARPRWRIEEPIFDSNADCQPPEQGLARDGV